MKQSTKDIAVDVIMSLLVGSFVFSTLSATVYLAKSAYYYKPIKVIENHCYKPTFKDAEHTWHVIPCPFKGDK